MHAFRGTVGLILVSCSSATSTTPTLTVQIHDAPTDDVQSVWVEFDEVSAHHVDDGWQVLSADTQTVDLLALQGGVVATLGSIAAQPGQYDQIRLGLVDAWVTTTDGQDAPLEVPSGFQTGIKIATDVQVGDCGDVVVDLDWDVGAHLNLNPQGYRLRPTLDATVLVDESTCGPQPIECLFADPDLEAVVRSAAGSPTGPLDSVNTASVTDLSASNQQIDSLAGIECLQNLEVLWLPRNQITDLTPLATTATLEELILSFNEVSSIDGLANKPNLRKLNLFMNPLSNVTNLDVLTGSSMLDSVVLYPRSGGAISDASGLANKTQLTVVNLYNHPVGTLDFLADSSALRVLYCDRCGISDLSPIADKTSLEVLSVGANPISSFTPLQDLVLLENLTLSSTGLDDVSILSDKTRLRYLYIQGNQLTDLSPIGSLCPLGNLEGIWAGSNPLTCPDPTLQSLASCGVSIFSGCY